MNPDEKKALDDHWNQVTTNRKKFRDREAYLLTEKGSDDVLAKIRELSLNVCAMCDGGKREYIGLSHVVMSASTTPDMGFGLCDPSIPTAALRCVKCGLVTQHCLVTLGLMELQAPLQDPLSMVMNALGVKDK